MSKPTFPRILRTAREHAGLSVAELATAIEMSRQFVHLLETGANGPSWRTIQMLANALGVSTEELRDIPSTVATS